MLFVLLTVFLVVFAILFNDMEKNTDRPASVSVSEPSESEESELPEQSASEKPEPPKQSGPDESQGEPEPSDPSEEDKPGKLEEPKEETPVFFNIPDELRAVQIVAGRDYLTGDTSQAALAAQLDQALAKVKELTMNTIIIDTKYNDAVLFSSSVLPQAQVDLDCVGYLVDKARELGLYVFATYDVSDLVDAGGQHLRACAADGETLDLVRECISEFAEKYEFDGILLNNYDMAPSADAYAQYNRFGGGIGYENYLRQVPQALVETAAASVRKAAPGTQVGLLVDAVWENASANEVGSETSADYTSLSDGNADTKAFVESGRFDFAMIKNFGSTTDPKAEFRTVASWWSQVAGTAGIRLYTLHANEQLGTPNYGWAVMEQLSKQLIDQEKIGGYSGSAFRSLKALAADNGGTTTTLVQYMNDQIDATYVLQQLSISKPAELTYKTREPTVTFQGASDPREPVTINGEPVQRNESGYFTVTKDLKEGLNTFAISHKNKTFTYNITREIIVLREIQPTGKISVDGGMTVTITALAYQGSSVTATVGGQTVTLSPSEIEDDSIDRESGYQLYVGVFTAPSASETATSLGTIKVTATMSDGHSMTLEGAAVTVNKKAKMGDGVVVQVTADQAETFPISTLNDNSDPNYYPLPKGTVDRTYGSEIIYKNGTKTYTYWKLQSGVRVYSDHITTGGQMPDNNEISSMSIKSSGQFTDVTLATGSKIPYRVSYDGSKIVFQFEYTAKVPDSSTANNALFKSAEWSGSNLTLNFRRSGGFLGYRAFYDDANRLVLRFNNSPGSLSGARIVVDPGHGGNDPGALGFYPGKDEADINLEVAQKLVNELKNQGATVLMVTPGSTMASRLAAARAFNPQVLVSVHSNTNVKSAPKGSEAYYFYPFQKQLAANVASNVSSALNTNNRGAKAGLYYMTRESQFACILAEMGFVSNESEYTKLINAKTQTKIAQGMAAAINSYLGGAATDYRPSDDDAEDEEDDDEPDSSEEQDDQITLDKTTLNLEVGESYTLKASDEVDFVSEDEEIASVSAGGKVTALARGTTYILAQVDDETVAECEVVVREKGASGSSSSSSSSSSSGTAKVSSVSLNTDELELRVDDTYTLKATVSPSDAANQALAWESDDESVATVSSSGVVKAIGEGYTTITVRTKDGDYTDSCEVEVSESSGAGGLVRSVSISGESEVAVESRITLSASVSPSDAKDTGVKWTVSDSTIAQLSKVYKDDGSLDEQKIKLEGLKNGMVEVTATAYDDGKAKDTVTIKVGTGKGSGSSSSSKEDDEEDEDTKPQKGVLVQSITISGPSKLELESREVYTAKVSPANAEDPGVKWSVSDSDILYLYRDDSDENKVKVEGLKKGTAELIATAYDDGKVTQRIKITVSD
ncbi:MAG: hypothetical protein HFG20_02025 [Anaerotruncus sp.]|nr:hypothetical protein [Anaerotruncus sp.]